MNFEALPSNCFNIGKKVKMKVTSAVPLCLLAGMAIVTCGCTAMKLRSEDPAVRMEAVKSYTTVEDWFDIAISDYPEDVRLYAFKQLTCDQEKLDDAICATTIRYYGPSKDSSLSINNGLGWYYPSVSLLSNMSEDTVRQIVSLASNTAGRKIVPMLLETKEYTKEQVAQIILVLLKKDTSSEIVKGDGRYNEWRYRGDFRKDLRGVLLPSISVIKDKGELVTVLDTLVSSGWIPILDEKSALTLLERFNDAQLWSCILEATERGVRGRGEIAKFMVSKLSKLSESLFARIYTSMYESADEATRLVLNTRLTQLYPKSELALDCLLNGQLDRESARRVMIEANAQKIFDRLQKRVTSAGKEEERSKAEERRKAIEAFAFIDLLNACPEFAQKVEPKAAASLLRAEHVCQAEKYANLPLPIAQAFIEAGTLHHTSFFGNSPCPTSDAILKRLPVATAYDILKKQGLEHGSRQIQEAIGGCALNDENVEALLRIDLAPFAIGLYRLQAALKADSVSAESKAKIQAHIEKLRAEAEANEAKAKQERLVIDHCYVPMREIDHVALPPKKVLSYGEKNGIITSFGWTAKQCYDWFEIENDRFQWEFAKKFGLSNFKFDMSVKAESQTSFNPELLLFDAMSGADTAVVSVPKISVQQWWLSTTRERGKNVEFLYNEEDKNNTLIMREIQ